jgi:hypothetical protein
LNKQKEITTRRVRSLSVGDGMNELEKEKQTKPSEIDDIESSGRRALYGTLPFFSTFGMSSREMTLRDVISKASFNAKSVIGSVGGKKVRLLGFAAAKSHEFLLQESSIRSNYDELEDVNVDEIVMTIPLSMAVVVAIISQFLVGYNTGVMNAPAAFVFPSHTTAQWSVSVAAFAVGGPGGAVLGGVLANRLGRRKAILVDSWLFFIGGVLMTFAPNVYCLIPARFIIGFAAGLSSVVVPVYLGEMAPPTLRGTLGTFTQFSIVIGILVSGLLGFVWASAHGWRYLFAVTPACCLFQVGTVFVVSVVPT